MVTLAMEIMVKQGISTFDLHCLPHRSSARPRRCACTTSQLTHMCQPQLLLPQLVSQGATGTAMC